MSVIVCLGPEKADRGYRCGCCGYTSPNLDSFAMSTCWPCSTGDNLGCSRCREQGVWVDRFSTKGTKGHRFKRWSPGGHYAITSCGQRIPRRDIGQGTAVRQPCGRCWPEESEREAAR